MHKYSNFKFDKLESLLAEFISYETTRELTFENLNLLGRFLQDILQNVKCHVVRKMSFSS